MNPELKDINDITVGDYERTARDLMKEKRGENYARKVMKHYYKLKRVTEKIMKKGSVQELIIAVSLLFDTCELAKKKTDAFFDNHSDEEIKDFIKNGLPKEYR